MDAKLEKQKKFIKNLIIYLSIKNKFFYKKQMDEHSKLTIKDFEIVKELGSGSFGKVKLVKKIANDVLYALKTVTLNRLNQK